MENHNLQEYIDDILKCSIKKIDEINDRAKTLIAIIEKIKYDCDINSNVDKKSSISFDYYNSPKFLKLEVSKYCEVTFIPEHEGMYCTGEITEDDRPVIDSKIFPDKFIIEFGDWEHIGYDYSKRREVESVNEVAEIVNEFLKEFDQMRHVEW